MILRVIPLLQLHNYHSAKGSVYLRPVERIYSKQINDSKARDCQLVC
jgi:hypothetical protein